MLQLLQVTKSRVNKGSSAAGCFGAMRAEIENLFDITIPRIIREATKKQEASDTPDDKDN